MLLCPLSYPHHEEILHAFVHKTRLPKARVMELLIEYLKKDYQFALRAIKDFRLYANTTWASQQFLDKMLQLHVKTKLAQILFLSKMFNVHTKVLSKSSQSCKTQQEPVQPEAYTMFFMYIHIDQFKHVKKKNKQVTTAKVPKRFCVQQSINAVDFERHIQEQHMPKGRQKPSENYHRIKAKMIATQRQHHEDRSWIDNIPAELINVIDLAQSLHDIYCNVIVNEGNVTENNGEDDTMDT